MGAGRQIKTELPERALQCSTHKTSPAPLPTAGRGSRLGFSELPLISPVDCSPVNSSSGVKLKSHGLEKPVAQRSWIAHLLSLHWAPRCAYTCRGKDGGRQSCKTCMTPRRLHHREVSCRCPGPGADETQGTWCLTHVVLGGPTFHADFFLCSAEEKYTWLQGKWREMEEVSWLNSPYYSKRNNFEKQVSTERWQAQNNDFGLNKTPFTGSLVPV